MKYIFTETPSSYRSYGRTKSTYEGWRSGGKTGEFSRLEGLAFLSDFEFSLNGTRPNVSRKTSLSLSLSLSLSRPTRSSDPSSGGPYRISLIAFLMHVTNRTDGVLQHDLSRVHSHRALSTREPAQPSLSSKTS